MRVAIIVAVSTLLIAVALLIRPSMLAHAKPSLVVCFGDSEFCLCVPFLLPFDWACKATRAGFGVWDHDQILTVVT